MPEIRLENQGLKVTSVGTGDIAIIDATPEDLIANGYLDSNNLPSSKLLTILNGIAEHVGLTWEGATHFDPLDRGLGGAVFMSNIWREVE